MGVGAFAERHLRRVFTKLGISSRTQLHGEPSAACTSQPLRTPANHRPGEPLPGINGLLGDAPGTPPSSQILAGQRIELLQGGRHAVDPAGAALDGVAQPFRGAGAVVGLDHQGGCRAQWG